MDKKQQFVDEFLELCKKYGMIFEIEYLSQSLSVTESDNINSMHIHIPETHKEFQKRIKIEEKQKELEALKYKITSYNEGVTLKSDRGTPVISIKVPNGTIEIG